jgi:hypothetical protein
VISMREREREREEGAGVSELNHEVP